MKKIRIFLATLVTILLFYSNKVYATTEGTYVPDTGSGIEKFILIVIGISAVALVLFIGYKMDKKEENKKRREKFIEENEESTDDIETFMEDNDDIYSAIYNSVTPDDLEDIVSDENQEDDDIKINNYIDENTKEDSIEEEKNIIDDDVVVEEDSEEQFINRNENIEKMISVFENADSTMVFNSQELKEKTDEEKLNIVKGYDYEEDDDLSELEDTIKAVTAHIKRYTRKKYVETEKNKEPLKRYTRKKNKEKPVSNVKRYTRKKPGVQKVEQPIIENEIVVEELKDEIVEIEKPKPKRGRPRKADQPVKPKRGRPKKVVEVEKPKRGRPRKTDAKKTTKKTTAKKATAKK